MNAISYAIDMKITNSNNVEFCAYFVDEDKQLTTIDKIINANDLKVYIEISVKNEGYLNGKISLEDSSFKFNKKYTDENNCIKEIDENTISLNQINAGNTAKIEVGIEFRNEDSIELKALNKDNKINLTGTYKNSKKDIEIEGTTTLKINWKSQEELDAKIGATVLTNKVYEVEGNSKRIVQILVDSKLENDLYPIKNTNIKLNVPQGVESVKVHSRSTNATNGDAEFNEENYKYNSDTGILEINIQNQEKDGKISWIKEKKDSLVVTYIYPDDVKIEEQDIIVGNVITTYDEKEIKANCKTSIEKEINGILTSNINLDETQIYKGKLYTGEERYYTTSTIINVNCALMDRIQIKEKEAVFSIEDEDKQANIQYVQSRISKKEFDTIVGEDGSITILDQDENIIANINKDTEVDENGYININYNVGVESLIIKISEPKIEETLNIYHRKVILDNKYTREQIAKFTGIKQEISNGYNENSIKTIELKNTESKASIEVSTDTLSIIKENKNIEIIATLQTNDESKDLYKNPSVDIIFPKEISGVKILSAKALYRNGLKVSKCEKIKNEDGNTVLHIDFDGEQKRYNSEILNGLEIHIYADLTLDKTTPNKISKFVMNYTNDNGDKESYSVDKQIKLESQEGLVLYNSISDYNKQDDKIEVIDEERTIAKLDMNTKETTAKIETALINNYDKDITEDVIIIGDIPVKDNENTFNAEISDVKVSNKDAEILYSTNIDAKEDDKSWSKDSTDAKSYKVILDEIDSGDVIKISYDISIPAKLSYNEKGVLATSLAYSYNEEDLSDSSNIVFETETAIVKETSTGNTYETDSGLEVNVVEFAKNRTLAQGDTIYAGEIIKYTVKVKNTTENDLNNLKITTQQTNGLIFDLVEKEVYNPSVYDNETATGIEHYWEITDLNTKDFENITIESGKEYTLEFQIVAKRGEEGTESYNKISIVSEDSTLNEEITTTKYQVQDSEIELLFVPTRSEEVIWNSETVQKADLYIKNNTDTELNDIDVQIILSNQLNCDKYENYIEAISDVEYVVKDKTINELGQTIITLKITKLDIGKTGKICVKPYINDITEKKENVELYASASTNNNIYYSNNIVKEVVRSRKQIVLTQTAKINGQYINENTIANDKDTVEFYITVKNEENENLDISLSNVIQNGLIVSNISLVENGETTNITDKYANNYFSYSLNLEKGKEIGVIITAKVDALALRYSEPSITNTIEINLVYQATVKFDVNVVIPDDGKLNVEIEQTSNPEDKAEIKDGQEIQYNVKIKNICNYDRTINIVDNFNVALKDIKILIEEKDVTKEYLSENTLQISNYTIKANTEINMVIKAKIDLENYELKTISNVVLIKSDYPDYSSNIITYYTPEILEEEPSGGEGEEEIENYVIKGTAWLDTNENGQREAEEELIKGLEIRAINTKTQEIIDKSVITDDNGNYEIDLPEGKYIIVFMYNNDDYYVTTYHADGVKDDVNSDAISKELMINEQPGIYGATDEINLTSNKNHIDIGLILRSKFDFKLDKYVSNVVVTNKGGTKTYDLNNTNLGKVEIASKYLDGSTVLVEYIIKVTNIGDVAGSVEKIVDNMPTDMKFSSSLNSDWYQSEKNLINESLSDKILDKGESAEVKIILTKQMTDSNTGLVNNTASIKDFKNIDNVKDIDEKNNKGSADLIITVKTGVAIRFSLLVISLTVCIAAIAYYVVKRKIVF